MSDYINRFGPRPRAARRADAFLPSLLTLRSRRRRIRDVATSTPSRPLTQGGPESLEFSTTRPQAHYISLDNVGLMTTPRCVPAGRPVFMVPVLLLRSPHELRVLGHREARPTGSYSGGLLYAYKDRVCCRAETSD